ncbi:MAG: hypothetical protein WC223_12275 [Bacteroidales bacterium]|jgi:hypothetical protein
MKKIFLIITAAGLMFASCKKEGKQVQTAIPVNNASSRNYDVNADSQGKFKKEITVTDESGQNTAFFAVYSDDEKMLSDYLENNEFSLLTNKVEVEMLKSANSSESTRNANDEINTNEKPKIIVDLVTSNTIKDVKSLSLSIKTKQTRNYIMGYPIGYTTSGTFIGIVHNGLGHEILVRKEVRKKWPGGWDYISSNFFLYYYSPYNASVYDQNNSYRGVGIVVWPSQDEPSTNYFLAYNTNDYRGKDCSIGGYDGLNCQVGTPPSGTTAFIYANNFYYTPVSGNQCPYLPYPESGFDGANCYVTHIPSGASAFIWSNYWYVKPNLLPY